MQLALVRDYAGTDVTLGTLTVGDLVLQTLELPWLPEPPPAVCGRPDRSCVPAGAYNLVLHDSPKHPKTFALVNPELCVVHAQVNVPSNCVICRTEVLIHVANIAAQLEGCIGVGRTRYKSGGQWTILQSRDAFEALQAVLPWVEGHTLAISYAAGVTPP